MTTDFETGIHLHGGSLPGAQRWSSERRPAEDTLMTVDNQCREAVRVLANMTMQRGIDGLPQHPAAIETIWGLTTPVPPLDPEPDPQPPTLTAEREAEIRRQVRNWPDEYAYERDLFAALDATRAERDAARTELKVSKETESRLHAENLRESRGRREAETREGEWKRLAAYANGLADAAEARLGAVRREAQMFVLSSEYARATCAPQVNGQDYVARRILAVVDGPKEEVGE